MSNKAQPMTEPQEVRSVPNNDPEKPSKKPMTTLEQVEPKAVRGSGLPKEPAKGQDMNDHMEVRSVPNPVREGELQRLKIKEGWQVKHDGKVRRGGDVLENVPASRAQHYLTMGWVEEVKQAQPRKTPSNK